MGNREKRKKRKAKEAAYDARRAAERKLRQWYVAVDPKTKDVLSFTNNDAIAITYAAVGGPEMPPKLINAVKRQQGKDDLQVNVVPITRTQLYNAALMRLPFVGMHILALTTKQGDEMVPITPLGAKWLRSKNFLVPEMEGMEIIVYCAGRLATNEYGRKFETLMDVSSVMPPQIIDAMSATLPSSGDETVQDFPSTSVDEMVQKELDG